MFFGGQVVEYGGIGGLGVCFGFFVFWQVYFVEQDFVNLFGRIQIEFVVCCFVGGGFGSYYFLGEVGREVVQLVWVDFDVGVFYVGQYLWYGLFQCFVDCCFFFGDYSWFQDFLQV